MKKLPQRLVAALCALVMPLVFTTGVLAADASPLPPDAGRLIIHKYAVDDTDALTLPGNGTELTQPPQDAVPLADIEFTIWRVEAGADPQPQTPAQARQYLDPNTAVQATTGADGTAAISLPQGLYYVEETKSTGRLVEEGGGLSIVERSYVPSLPFLVAVPLESPDGNDWLTDVHVYPKNQVIYIDKFVNEPEKENYTSDDMIAAKYKPVHTGKPFGWTIVSSLPGSLGAAAGDTYVVTDPLLSLFTYQPGTLDVYSATEGSTPYDKGFPLRPNIDYTETFQPRTNTLTVTLTPEGISLLRGRYINAESQDRFLVIKYDCILDENAPHGVNIPSGASVTYTRQEAPAARRLAAVAVVALPSSVVKATSTVAWEPSVHTGQIGITKVDSQHPEQRLAGATFGIAATKAEAEAGNFLHTGITDKDGRLIFTGLAYGAPGDKSNENSTNTTYWLVEISPPSGYAPLPDAVEVFFNYHKVENTGEIYFAQLTVYNEPLGNTTPPAATLPGGRPQTGDNNPLALLVGLLLLSLAGFLVFYRLWAKQRRAAARNDGK